MKKDSTTWSPKIEAAFKILMKKDSITWSPKTEAAFKMLTVVDTPAGYVKALAPFLSAIAKDRCYGQTYREVVSEIEVENLRIQGLQVQLLEWMRERIKDLRKCRCSRKERVKNVIDELDAKLNREAYYLIGYLKHVSSCFFDVCSMVAKYGRNPFIDSWMVIDKETVCYTLEDFPKPKKHKEEFDAFGKYGMQLSDRLNGFIVAVAEPVTTCFIPKNETRFLLTVGLVADLSWPQSYIDLNENWSRDRWQFDQDFSSVGILNYLNQLTQAIHPNPVLQDYYNRFLVNDWAKSPMSRDELSKMVDRLLSELDQRRLEMSSPIGKVGKRVVEEEARKIIREALQASWPTLQESGPGSGPARTHQPFTTVALKALLKANMTASNNLINEEVKAFAKTMGFRPKRGKDRVKRIGY